MDIGNEERMAIKKSLMIAIQNYYNQLLLYKVVVGREEFNKIFSEASVEVEELHKQQETKQ